MHPRTDFATVLIGVCRGTNIFKALLNVGSLKATLHLFILAMLCSIFFTAASSFKVFNSVEEVCNLLSDAFGALLIEDGRIFPEKQPDTARTLPIGPMLVSYVPDGVPGSLPTSEYDGGYIWRPNGITGWLAFSQNSVIVYRAVLSRIGSLGAPDGVSEPSTIIATTSPNGIPSRITIPPGGTTFLELEPQPPPDGQVGSTLKLTFTLEKQPERPPLVLTAIPSGGKASIASEPLVFDANDWSTPRNLTLVVDEAIPAGTKIRLGVSDVRGEFSVLPASSVADFTAFGIGLSEPSPLVFCAFAPPSAPYPWLFLLVPLQSKLNFNSLGYYASAYICAQIFVGFILKVVFNALFYTLILALVLNMTSGPERRTFGSYFVIGVYAGFPAVIVATLTSCSNLPWLDFQTCYLVVMLIYSFVVVRSLMPKKEVKDNGDMDDW